MIGYLAGSSEKWTQGYGFVEFRNGGGGRNPQLAGCTNGWKPEAPSGGWMEGSGSLGVSGEAAGAGVGVFGGLGRH